MNVYSSMTNAAGSPEARNNAGSEARLQGVWLVLARSVWVAVSVLAVGLFVASLPSYFAYLHIPGTTSYASPQLTPGDVETLRGLGLSLDLYAWLDVSVYVVILLAYVLVGSVLFWRKSDDRMALLASLVRSHLCRPGNRLPGSFAWVHQPDERCGHCDLHLSDCHAVPALAPSYSEYDRPPFLSPQVRRGTYPCCFQCHAP
jgi:hypothetical protein